MSWVIYTHSFSAICSYLFYLRVSETIIHNAMAISLFNYSFQFLPFFIRSCSCSRHIMRIAILFIMLQDEDYKYYLTDKSHTLNFENKNGKVYLDGEKLPVGDVSTFVKNMLRVAISDLLGYKDAYEALKLKADFNTDPTLYLKASVNADQLIVELGDKSIISHVGVESPLNYGTLASALRLIEKKTPKYYF